MRARIVILSGIIPPLNLPSDDEHKGQISFRNMQE